MISQMFEERREKRLPEREGAFFLIYREGRVLLEERLRPDKPYYGYTIVPGGKVEKGKDKDHLEAAAREIEEECGIKPKKIIKLDNFLHVTISNHLYDTTAYLVIDFDGEVKNVEGKSRHLWVRIEDAPKLLSFADSRYVVLLAQLYLLRQNS